MAHMYIDNEESRCHSASLLHPCTDCERFCFRPVDEDTCCHLVVDCDKVGRAIKSGQNFPESFTVDGIEGLSQIIESYVN